ncbi:ORF6N domain-containing protein [Pedobacter sp. Du54]|uniref:ORF6N domain-containing protein n=1 Tax=Pedobacter anseongensis TaxID=3133439 RepID=UPI0030B377FD
MKRFPEDFMFQLSEQEWSNLKSQIVISSWGGAWQLPYAFTEQGVAMLDLDNIFNLPLESINKFRVCLIDFYDEFQYLFNPKNNRRIIAQKGLFVYNEYNFLPKFVNEELMSIQMSKYGNCHLLPVQILCTLLIFVYLKSLNNS